MTIKKWYKNYEQSYTKAKEYYEISKDIGNSKAWHKLGELYENIDYYAKPNYSKARECYFQAVNMSNDRFALYTLDFHFLNGFAKPDYLKAKYYFELSAKQKNTLAFPTWYFI